MASVEDNTEDNKEDGKANYIHNKLLSTYYREDVYAYIKWAQTQLPEVEDDSDDFDEEALIFVKAIKQEPVLDEDEPVFIRAVKDGKKVDLPLYEARDIKSDTKSDAAKYAPAVGEAIEADQKAATVASPTLKLEKDTKYKHTTSKYRLEHHPPSTRHGKREDGQQGHKDRQQSYITQLHDVCNRKHWPLPLWTLELDEDRRRIHRHQAAVKIRNATGRVVVTCIDSQRTSTQSMTRERVARMALMEIHEIDKK